MQPFILLGLTLFTSLAASAAIPVGNTVSHNSITGDKPTWHLSKRQLLSPDLPPPDDNPPSPAPNSKHQQGEPWELDRAPSNGLPNNSGFPTPESLQRPTEGTTTPDPTNPENDQRQDPADVRPDTGDSQSGRYRDERH